MQEECERSNESVSLQLGWLSKALKTTVGDIQHIWETAFYLNVSVVGTNAKICPRESVCFPSRFLSNQSRCGTDINADRDTSLFGDSITMSR